MKEERPGPIVRQFRYYLVDQDKPDVANRPRRQTDDVLHASFCALCFLASWAASALNSLQNSREIEISSPDVRPECRLDPQSVPSTINVQLSAIRKLAAEAADSRLLDRSSAC